MKKKISPKNKIISSKNIFLRYFKETDVTLKYLEMINDKDTTKYLDNPTKKTKADLLNYFKKINRDKNFHFFAIIERQTNRYIGNAKIGPIDNFHKRTSFGRLIHKDYHNAGYGSEVSSLLIKVIFERLKLNRILLGVLVKNIGSYKSNIKAGLDSETILKKYVYHNGKYEDTYLLGLTKERYFQKKKAKLLFKR